MFVALILFCLNVYYFCYCICFINLIYVIFNMITKPVHFLSKHQLSSLHTVNELSIIHIDHLQILQNHLYTTINKLTRENKLKNNAKKNENKTNVILKQIYNQSIDIDSNTFVILFIYYFIDHLLMVVIMDTNISYNYYLSYCPSLEKSNDDTLGLRILMKTI